MYGDIANKYFKFKRKYCYNKITRNFHGRIPKEGFKRTSLPTVVVVLFKSGENVYPHAFLKKRKYKINEKE